MKPFRFKIKKQTPLIGIPSLPKIGGGGLPESLSGVVQGVKASAPEERMAKALDKANIQYIFRYTVGAPRGLPGWKELDFLVMTKGMVYAVEVDTAFTHRGKDNSDVLHDAIVQNDKDVQAAGSLWPSVIHVDGEGDLADQDKAEKYVAKAFGKGSGSAGGGFAYSEEIGSTVVATNTATGTPAPGISQDVPGKSSKTEKSPQEKIEKQQQKQEQKKQEKQEKKQAEKEQKAKNAKKQEEKQKAKQKQKANKK